MAVALSDLIIHKIGEASGLYHRLLLVVGPTGSGKTIALREVAEQLGAPIINVSLELSRVLLELTEQQRALKLLTLLENIVTAVRNEVTLLDNTELLFDLALKQDPLRLLKSISRNRTIVATWSGAVDDSHLIYAAPHHPEYRHYATDDLIVVTTEKQNDNYN